MFRFTNLRKRLLISAIVPCVASCFGLGVLLLPQTALLAQDISHSSSVLADTPKLALIPMPREIRLV